MAKHSHWDNIKHKKAVNDKKKASVIAKMGKLLTVAVQVGGGPNLTDNPRLRLAFDKARSAGMNMEAIERAINKAAGLGTDGKLMAELAYEGYAPGGVAIVVTALTDNRTRTAPEIKKLFERSGGSMGVPGCVSWQFKDKAVFLCEKTSEDAVMEALLAANADAEDIAVQEEGQVSITAAPQQFDLIGKALAGAAIAVASSDITKLPDNLMSVSDLDQAQRIQELLEALDDQDDVQSVYHNASFSPEISAQLQA
jgi:YebC/PmpR family DNA-binding regulatory protein